MNTLLQGDSVLGALPAPIRNPEAWPPNYAKGWNDCSRVALDSMKYALASKASPDDQRQEGVALPPRRQASDYIADTYGPADLAAIWNACRSETSRLNSASPPTEAAASDVIDFKARAGREAFQRHPFTLPGSVPVAGTFDEIERELRDIGAGSEPMTWDYLHARMNALADQLAALSPTASAAREGSK